MKVLFSLTKQTNCVLISTQQAAGLSLWAKGRTMQLPVFDLKPESLQHGQEFIPVTTKVFTQNERTEADRPPLFYNIKWFIYSEGICIWGRWETWGGRRGVGICGEELLDGAGCWSLIDRWVRGNVGKRAEDSRCVRSRLKEYRWSVKASGWMGLEQLERIHKEE